ncbi:hypothetical protein A4G99_00980 [Haladaptatus sp. R4]|uniref:hypothetical protein n=1 Tax=Haladaptatus sp. R4 TaxID=1679489 RepID=UPI0007B4CF40|nr:hypothetical protein [Haladaptatus sp. R4]KZN25135.1 hypothetical protein A4G99_00980 [Haladaptatus sp. R4]
MHLRPPRFRSLSAVLGLFIGSTIALSLPWLWPDAPANAVEIGILFTLLGWVAVEQFAAEIDRAVVARRHWLLAVVGVLPFVALLVTRALTGSTSSGEIVLHASLFGMVAFVAFAACSSRYATIRLQTESIRGNVVGVKSRLYDLPLTMASSAIGMFVLHLLLPGTFSLDFLSGSVVGSLIGAVIGAALVGNHTVELVALDDGLVIASDGRGGGSFVPWRRIRGVRLDGDTLRVARGLPWPMVYEADLSSAVHPDTVVHEFRSRVH